MSGLPDKSVDLAVFSPPFADLYVYSASDRDVGNCRGENEFFEHFYFVRTALRRIMVPGRMVCIHCMNLPTVKARDGVIGLRDFRGAIISAMIDSGFIFHSEVVIWKDPVTAMQRTKALGLLHKQLKKDSCMSRMGIPDYVVTFRTPGENPKPVSHTNDTFPVSQWQEWASPIWSDINQTDVLAFREAREHEDEKHICPLQLEVIRRCLVLWSNPGDVVLDPFGGIGSVGYEALRAGRKTISIELKPSYFAQNVRHLSMARDQLALL